MIWCVELSQCQSGNKVVESVAVAARRKSMCTSSDTFSQVRSLLKGLVLHLQKLWVNGLSIQADLACGIEMEYNLRKMR